MDSPGPPILRKEAHLTDRNPSAAADNNTPPPPVLEKCDHDLGNQTVPPLKVKRKPRLVSKRKDSPRATRSRTAKVPQPPPPTVAEGEAGKSSTAVRVTKAESPPHAPILLPHDGISTQEILGQDSMTEPQLFVNQETGDYGNASLHPELINCEDVITPGIIKKLAHSQARKALRKIFESVGIRTIGDLSRQTEVDVIKFPLIPPKFETTRKILEEYKVKVTRELETANKTLDVSVATGDAAEVDLVSSFVVANLKRTYQRKKKAPATVTRIPKDSVSITTANGGVETEQDEPAAAAAAPIDLDYVEAEALIHSNKLKIQFEVSGVEMEQDELAVGAASIDLDYVEDEALVHSHKPEIEFETSGVEMEQDGCADAASASIDFESVDAEAQSDQDQVMRFLQSGKLHVQDFLDRFLKEDAVILKSLIERDDFPKRVWEVCGTKFFKKTPLVLCDRLMTLQGIAKDKETYDRDVNVRVPRDFWRDTLGLLVDSYTQAYQEVMKSDRADAEDPDGQELAERGPEIRKRLRDETWARFTQGASTHADQNESASHLNGEAGATGDGILDAVIPSPPASAAGLPSIQKKTRVDKVLEIVHSMNDEERATLFLRLYHLAQGNS